MRIHQALFIKFYDKVVLRRPGWVVLGLIAAILFLGYMAKDFRLDASADSLLLEHDEDLRYSRVVNARYGVRDFLLIAYTPTGGESLFSDKTLESLARLKDELESLPRVESVFSILDAPLLDYPGISVKQLAENIQTLKNPAVDREQAKTEFSSSPFYKDLLVSADLSHTALQINFRTDTRYRELQKRRDQLQQQAIAGTLSESDRVELEEVALSLRRHKDVLRETQHNDIAAIRAIMDKYRSHADLFLGGVGMISDDMITFIRNDLRIFGLGVFLLLVVTLSIIFRAFRWIVLPLLCCVFAVIAMMGFLGMFGWEVTVISSNFICLQLIITLAMVIHLIVRYRELVSSYPEVPHRQLVLDTVRTKIIPCLYAALTTIAGFSSLMLCDILPVINFGWMMSAGIAVSLVITFLLFPAGLMLIGPETASGKPAVDHVSLTRFFARFTQKHGTLILVATGIAFILGVAGISRLAVENSFIDYFKETTEIYKGMKTVDQHLGGTTPLDVILRFDPVDLNASDAFSGAPVGNDTDFADFEEFESEEMEDKYWFAADKMDRIMAVHDYLEGLPEIGKVLSLGTLLKIAEKYKDDQPLDTFELAVLYSKLPEKYKSLVLTPYLSIPDDEVRFSARIKDSLKTLKRDALLKKIRHDLVNDLEIDSDYVRLTGIMVLYNNMLQSLFRSQILTLGAVLLALFTMFLILFRSVKVALIALFPNLFASGSVLGAMGWLDIPLDLMTITIAAISIGIAVDNTIHYIHRFRHEIRAGNDYYGVVHCCHRSVGHAMNYTSLTIIIGFSILAFSNFIPTIYFGLFTGLAMFIALIAALTLLPQLLVMFKPFE